MLEELTLETIEGDPHKYKAWKWRDGEAEKTGVRKLYKGAPVRMTTTINEEPTPCYLMAESNDRREVLVPIAWLSRYAETPIPEPEVRH